MTREEQNQAQALDLEERQRQAEEAFERVLIDWQFSRRNPDIDVPQAKESDWATIASEMGILEFYRKLKDGR